MSVISEFQDAFQVSRYQINRDHWDQGFVNDCLWHNCRNIALALKVPGKG